MTDLNELFLIDTNILVYAYERETSVKKKKAEGLIGKCFNGIINLVVSNQNLSEFVFVTTKKANLSSNQAKLIVDDIINIGCFRKIDYSAETILSAIEITDIYKVPFWDSLIAATMKENGIFNIYTENVKDFKIPWINAVNPFR